MKLNVSNDWEVYKKGHRNALRIRAPFNIFTIVEVLQYKPNATKLTIYGCQTITTKKRKNFPSHDSSNNIISQKDR